jgi:1,4-alpha-glucan branching enzyme
MSEVAALLAGHEPDPFAILGPHEGIVRALLPGAHAVHLLDPAGGKLSEATRHGDLFEAPLAAGQAYKLQIDWGNDVQIVEDTYSFGPLLSDLDIFLFAEGTHRDLGACLGAQPMMVNDVPGVRFAVWAPNAQRVSVVGHFNNWDGRRHVMRRRDAGLWEVFIPRLGLGESYKYEILGPHGVLPLKADPYARQAEIPPLTASVVAAAVRPPKRRARPGFDTPLSIYEVHAPSWMRHADGRSYSWGELAARLIPYATDMGFTHIELLPIMAHPFGGSWGYQPLGQYAPMPNLGSPQDFADFVSACHAVDLGVILDWVPAHFPTDTHGLADFDGTKLFEHADPREGFHQDWNTLIFNLGRTEVREYLISSALTWIETYGVDGLRVDAVASMLYRDYSRKAGEWVPNRHGGRENLESIAFLQELSRVLLERAPGILLIAEESTAWPGVTKPADEGGLGFTHKWNMGWMHDTLDFMHEDAVNRRYHHDQMTFGIVYAFSEHFVLPISHDEVVHGKSSLLGRMPGDEWQRFANLRAYLGFMWGHPGKKLLFMGCEFGQPTEWNHDAELNWGLLANPHHAGVQASLRALNGALRSSPALYQLDFEPAGFRWVVGDDRDQSVMAFMRYGHAGSAPVLVICNFTPVPRHHYRLGADAGTWEEIFCSDDADFGGSGLRPGSVSTETVAAHGYTHSVRLTLPPLSTVMLRHRG